MSYKVHMDFYYSHDDDDPLYKIYLENPDHPSITTCSIDRE